MEERMSGHPVFVGARLESELRSGVSLAEAARTLGYPYMVCWRYRRACHIKPRSCWDRDDVVAIIDDLTHSNAQAAVLVGQLIERTVSRQWIHQVRKQRAITKLVVSVSARRY
jgi:hypothetical protein